MTQDKTINKDIIKEIVFAATFSYTIAGTRTFANVWAQGKKIMSIDDDSLAFNRMPKRAKRDEITRNRRAKVEELKPALYAELTQVTSIKIGSFSEYKSFLNIWVNQPDTFTDEARVQVKQTLGKYYTYNPDQESGLIPLAAGEILINDTSDPKTDIESRLRFRRIYDLPRYLIASENTGTTTYTDLPDIDTVEYDWVPVDLITIFGQTLGAKAGDALVGRVFKRDLRGIAGSIPDSEVPALPIAWVSGHFGGDRDNSAEGLLREALGKWQRDGKINFNNLQQVVRKATFIEVDGSASIELNVGNQACCNMFAIDLTRFAIPTTGGWLRIEEPLEHSLVLFVLGCLMAWQGVGGHERFPGLTRPDVLKQFSGRSSDALSGTNQYFR